MPVPYTFGTATAAIPLSQLDSNFATAVTIGNTAVQLGNTVTTLNNLTLANVTISSGNVTITNVAVTTANVSGTANVSSLVVLTNETVLGNTAVTGNVTASINVTGAKLIPTGTSVTGNGLYLPAANALGLSTNGTNAVYIDSSQNVGIGTSSPATNYKLSVNGTGNFYNGVSGLGRVFLGDPLDSSGYVGMYRSTGGPSGSTTGGNWLNFASIDGYTFSGGAGVPFGSQTERMRIDSSGNVGIGTSSPSAKLNVVGGGTSALIVAGGSGSTIRNTASGGSSWFAGTNVDSYILHNESNTPMLFTTNGTERMRIDSSGNLLVGTTSASGRFTVNGAGTSSALFSLVSNDSAGATLFAVRNDGALQCPKLQNFTSGSAANVYYDGTYLYKSTSSLKYKTDVQNATHGLTELLNLRPVIYKGKSEADEGKTFGGLIAEEVHEAGLTEFVQYAEDGSPDALAYGNMVSLCIKAIQEQQAIIQSLTTRITALEQK